jgi:hypothetical protein
MSFWKKLFGGGGAAQSAPQPAQTEDYGGYTIAATPFQAEGRWQLCGVISREIDGGVKEHQFIRADAFGSRDDAVQMTFFKGRQIIDQQGESLLRS